MSEYIEREALYHNDVFWQNSGCNLLNNGEHCQYVRDCHRGIYKITDITNLDGTKRTDGRYPLRIGCIGLLDISDLKPDRSLVFKYLKDNIGEDKNGFLITSSVPKVS